MCPQFLKTIYYSQFSLFFMKSQKTIWKYIKASKVQITIHNCNCFPTLCIVLCAMLQSTKSQENKQHYSVPYSLYHCKILDYDAALFEYPPDLGPDADRAECWPLLSVVWSRGSAGQCIISSATAGRQRREASCCRVGHRTTATPQLPAALCLCPAAGCLTVTTQQ